MPGRRIALVVAAIVFAVPAVLVLGAPALALRIALRDSPGLREFLAPWLWASAAALPLSVLVVRLGSACAGRWPAYGLRAVLLLAVLNGVAYVQLVRHELPGVVLPHVQFVYGPAALAAIAVLVAARLWDRRRAGQAARKLAR